MLAGRGELVQRLGNGRIGLGRSDVKLAPEVLAESLRVDAGVADGPGNLLLRTPYAAIASTVRRCSPVGWNPGRAIHASCGSNPVLFDLVEAASIVSIESSRAPKKLDPVSSWF